MAGLISSLFIKLTSDTSKFESGMNRAGRKLTAFQKQSMAASKAVNKFAGALGLVASGATFIRLSRDAINLGSRLDDVSQKLSISTKFLQEFGFAARETGVKT